MPTIELKISADGSHTLYHQELDETYHSVHGSIQEALHVFIRAGLNPIFNTKEEIHLLEMGFGTGLNAFLTLSEAKKVQKKVHYHSLESFPLDENIWTKLNFHDQLKSNREEIVEFEQLHRAVWNEWNIIHPQFNLLKEQTHLETWYSPYTYDLVYYDAFGPRVQPELWEEPIFQKLHSMMNTNGMLVTYCAKGSVKRAIKASGFEIESLPGPPGKREMTRAIKI